MSKYRCVNKECRHYYWVQFFIPPILHYGEYKVEDENLCASCSSECQEVIEEKSIDLNFGYISPESGALAVDTTKADDTNS